jgi:type I restriction enzyme S subunit
MTSMTKHTLVDCFSLRARIGWQGLRSDEFKTEGPYLVTGTDFHNGRVDWDDCYHVTEERYAQDKGIQLHEHDLLITKDGTIGKTAVVIDCPEKATLNSGVFVVRAINNDVVPEFLHYILHSYWFDEFVRNVLTGSTIKHLNQEKFNKFTFEAPDVPTQRRIVRVLESIDEVIDKTTETIDKYRKLKTGVLEDFVRKGADGRPDLLNTGNPTVAKGWRFRCLDDLTTKIADRDHTTPIYVKNNGVLIVSPKDFDEDENIIFSNCEMISLKAHLINRKRTDITPGDLIFTRIGAGLGKVCLVTEDMPEFSILHSAAMIRTNNLLNSQYLAQIIRSYYFQKQISMGIQSIGVPDLGMDKIKELKVLYPIDIKEQENIANVLYGIDAIIQEEKAHRNKLINIKNGLLQDLLSGHVSAEPLS